MYLHKFKQILNVHPNGILHVGAHKAEELNEYEKNEFYGNGKIYWVEGQEDICKEIIQILDKSRNIVIQAFAWNKDGEKLEFNLTNKSASSSLFSLDQHTIKYPEIFVREKITVYTSRLETVLPKDAKFDYVAMDIQGSELMALEGLGGYIDQVKWIYTEVSRERLYKNAPLINDLDTYLATKGFRRRFTAWDRKANWGDALYIRESIFSMSFGMYVSSILWICRRVIRSYIPQRLFPMLVKIKRLTKKLIMK